MQPPSAQAAPGIYRQAVYPPVEPALLTGVPVFLGYAADGPLNETRMLSQWPQFGQIFGPAIETGYLAHAVRGFFENDGLICYVLRLNDDDPPVKTLSEGLQTLTVLENVDLVCAPDTMRTNSPSVSVNVDEVIAMQRTILDHCRQLGDRFAILDNIPHNIAAADGRPGFVEQSRTLISDWGALYFPWLSVPETAGSRWVPPCGHIAGAYSRSDQRLGVHKAPANEPLNGVLDLRVNLGPQKLAELYATKINCLQALPGRGIRVRGARTLSNDPVWRYVNTRRVFLSIGRRIERFMAELVFEPNDIRLWVRIMRELTAFLDELFRHGALKGRTPEEAFFVKCDSETNPPAVTAAGRVVTEIGLALAVPAEYIIVRIIHGASGVTIEASG